MSDATLNDSLRLTQLTLVLRNYCRGHQSFWNCELLLVYWLMRRATTLIHTSEIKNFAQFTFNYVCIDFVKVRTLIMLMSFLKQAQRQLTWFLRATWCPQAPSCWWPLNQWHNEGGKERHLPPG